MSDVAIAGGREARVLAAKAGGMSHKEISRELGIPKTTVLRIVHSFAAEPSWTDERVEMLKKLWADGLTASQIVKKIGGGITRSAVCGKIKRLGISGSHSRSIPKQLPSQKSNPMLLPRPAFKALPAPAAPAGGVAFEDLDAGQCRYPLGDLYAPAQRFCGAQAPYKQPYCEEHAKEAFVLTPRQIEARKLLRGAA